MVLGQKRD
ncbi:hypothetical protein BDFB_003413 [Asbolus verrucosus]|uniref:Uncharacterized protein n=1 Tax=Asbolus verrucosus TaxID=1661398 RepID=A0A482VSX2_ASBVE|nr:hypothetical protein BDFB_003413 [Asbolus verrucosus]